MVTQEVRVNHSIIPVVEKQSEEEIFPSACPPRLPLVDDSSSLSSAASAMTVEQSAAGQVENRDRKHHKNRETVLNQLKEITGVKDEHILKQALEASRNESGSFDLTQAVNILVDENAVCYNQALHIVSKTIGAAPVADTLATKTADDVRVIDLTSETSEKDELQKAIALSLQEQQHGMLGGQVTAEEQDISLVLERSLLTESMVGAKRKRGEIWQDPLNPHERKRKDCCPVGLKNVGNTCWFSAVIQEKRNLLFMQQLRHLFALMVGTRRKYVDPSKAVEILKEAFQSGSNDSQQDVSEFTHKLLEWLEDAFKSDSPGSSSPSFVGGGSTACIDNDDELHSKRNNPMLDLFYGQFRSEGLNNGHVFSNEETFGQYPLQVNGFGNIHESLEAATAQEIETNSAEAMTKSGQEHWFTRLPPVLLFELSRFQFNQHMGRPEKIHNKFDFQEVVYMDRYMEVNKNMTKMKRDSIRKLKDQRDELQARLERFLNFGSGSKRFPLQDVLQYTLEFVEKKRESVSPLPTDVEMASPNSNLRSQFNSDNEESSRNKKTQLSNVVEFLSTHSAMTDSPSCSPVQVNSTSDTKDVICDKGRKLASCAVSAHSVHVAPFPRHVSEMELRVLQNCLRRWRTEVETDIKELQDLIWNIDISISNMYNEDAFQKVPYRLHAVLVHEGQAASGHYWAYVYDHHNKRWLKFNDITVAESTWDELEKESAGGYHNASAYCLMYIDSTRSELVGHCIDEESGHELIGSVDSLLPDLLNFVVEDNLRFQKEIDAWDHNQEIQKGVEVSVTAKSRIRTAAKDDLVLDKDKDEETTSKTPLSVRIIAPEPVNIERFALSQHYVMQTLILVENVLLTDGPEAALTEALKLEVKHFKDLANSSDPLFDGRLEHISVYLMANGVPVDPLIVWILLEQFTHSSLDLDRRGRQIRRVAEQRLHHFLLQHVQPQHRELYNTWQRDFKEFCKLATLFATGLELFHDCKYSEALPYLVSAYTLNDLIEKKRSPGCDLERRAFDSKLLSYYRRQNILKLSEHASCQFEADGSDSAKEALQLMNDFVVPCMNFLNALNASKEDCAAADHIRGTWCSKLGDDISSAKSELLPDLLGKLLDPSEEEKLRDEVPLLRSTQELSDRFRAAMNLAQNSGCLEAAYQSR